MYLPISDFFKVIHIFHSLIFPLNKCIAPFFSRFQKCIEPENQIFVCFGHCESDINGSVYEYIDRCYWPNIPGQVMWASITKHGSVYIQIAPNGLHYHHFVFFLCQRRNRYFCILTDQHSFPESTRSSYYYRHMAPRVLTVQELKYF